MSAKSVNIMRGCTLYQRSKSDYWQVRVKLDSGEWYRKTTGKLEIEEAKQEALRLFYTVRDRAEQNLPQQTRRFRQLAKVVVRELNELQGTARWKTTYKDYIEVINAHLIPYFGNFSVDRLRVPFEGYVAWLTVKLGREPAESTLRNHFAALNIVFGKAVQLGYVTSHQLPSLKLTGRRGERGASFERGEYMGMINRLRAWCRTPSKNARTNELKALLYDYVLLLANTGIRHGEEVMRVQWRHVEWANDTVTGQRVLLINAWTRKGRGGGDVGRHRTLVARWTAVEALQRIHKRTPSLNALDFDELLKKKVSKPVIQLANGSKPKQLDALFRRFLSDADMEKGSRSERRRTLYSLRHYYATMALTRANPVPINVLAQQMGTSVAMIQKHYSHLQLIDVADQLAGERWDELAKDV